LIASLSPSILPPSFSDHTNLFFKPQIIIFYVLGILIIGLLVPYNSERLLNSNGNDASASPFVIGSLPSSDHDLHTRPLSDCRHSYSSLQPSKTLESRLSLLSSFVPSRRLALHTISFTDALVLLISAASERRHPHRRLVRWKLL